MRSLTIICLGMLISACSTQASQLVGYKAEYDFFLATKSSDAEVTEINGKSAYHLSNSCDGWDAIEDYILKFTYETGE